MNALMQPFIQIRARMAWGLLGLLLAANTLGMMPAQARYYPYRDQGGYGSNYHPYIQKALIGGGIGAVAGGLLSRRDPVGAGVKGALLGSAAGVGYQYLTSQNRYGGYAPRYNNAGNYRNQGFYGNPGYGRHGRGHHYGHGHHRDWDGDGD